MNEKTEKDGTGKLQSNAGIAKTEGSTAATCAQTSADADRASRTIPAAASRRLGAATALYALLYTICLYRNASGITFLLSSGEFSGQLLKTRRYRAKILPHHTEAP